MASRALITGISGFVGGFLAGHLTDCGDEVVGCSPTGGWEGGKPEGLGDRVALLAWDLARPEGPPEATLRHIDRFGPQAIYHLAGLSVPEDCGTAEPTPQAVAINVDGTRRVLELAANLRSTPRVLFVSSAHVYAPVSRQASRVDENAPLRPRSAYGKTKLAAEQAVLRAVAAGADAIVVRAFQHTGPRQNPRMMLPQWARQFAAGCDPVEVFTRDAYVDLTDVRDVVRAYRLLVEQGGRGEVYNVGSGRCRRCGAILETLHRMADPGRSIVATSPGVKQEPIADITKLTGLTGWRPMVPLEQTVADTLAYWRGVV